MATLYIIPTPIGNLEDITVRAKNVLEKLEVIFCEDTRVTRKLFSLLKLSLDKKNFYSNFEHNEKANVTQIIDLLKKDTDVGIVTDAGTPLISDPGFPIVREVRKILKENPVDYKEIKVEVLPGASSVIVSLAGSGLPTDKFTFLGFVPKKPGDRRKLFKSVQKSSNHLTVTYITFESHFRLQSTIEVIHEQLGKNVYIVIAKELTKLHERFYEGNIIDIKQQLKDKKLNIAGELILLFRTSPNS
ncbi:MAG: rRNA (cytidine1402-2-O)-methyltransferase [Patescibacteria group bacterium]|nr:rRNA (cytidine1402-2-O)-methyltransferase [Patescibacteria group bacterium]